jgi:hypothetical protein
MRHIPGEVRANSRATGKEEIGHHNLSTQIVQGNGIAHLIHERYIVQLMPNGVGYPLSVHNGFGSAFRKVTTRHFNRVLANGFYNQVTDYRQQDHEAQSYDGFFTQTFRFAPQRYDGMKKK